MKKISILLYHAFLVILLFCSLNSMAAIIVKDTVQNSLDSITEQPLPFAEEMAQYPGGTSAMIEFLSKNIRYPEEAAKNGISGKVYVQFVIDKEGNIHQPKVLKGIGGGCDEEAVRMIKLFPKWIPAKHKGKIVSAFYTLPITFQIQVQKNIIYQTQNNDQLTSALDEFITETQPCYFPGGMESLALFVKRNLQYPKDAEEKGIKGVVTVEFKIDKEGKVINPRVTHKVYSSLDQEALRIVNLLPNWIPANRHGKPVTSYYSLDFTFGFDLKLAVPDSNFTDFKNDTVCEEPLAFVEQMPEFPGGMDGLIKYLQTNIRYPAEASKYGITGRVIAQFIVNKTGSVENIKIIRGIGGKCEEEVIRLIKNMPKWKPGYQDGKPVPVYFTLPVTFSIK